MNHLFENIAVALSIIYLLLVIKESIYCWYADFVSSAIFIVLFWNAHLIMSSLLQFYYMAMAIYGWYRWRAPNNTDEKLSITTLNRQQHVKFIALILTLTFLSAFILAHYTHAKSPLFDSLITWGSIVTTYLVANKALENWLYWIVFDSLAIGLYFERGLTTTAFLFLVYSLLAVLGFVRWRKRMLTTSNLKSEDFHGGETIGFG